MNIAVDAKPAADEAVAIWKTPPFLVPVALAIIVVIIGLVRAMH